jgi:hypothetical protein
MELQQLPVLTVRLASSLQEVHAQLVLWGVTTVLRLLSVRASQDMSGTLLLLLASVKLRVKPAQMQLTAALTVRQEAVLLAKQAFSSFRATQHARYAHGHV